MASEFYPQSTTNGKPIGHEFITYPGMHMNGGAVPRNPRTTSAPAVSFEGLDCFDRLDLNPRHTLKSELQNALGNPTPVGILGILISLTPLSCDLMGWRGAGGDGAASVGAYMFFGGGLLIISGLLEFVLGNTFSFVVFMSFAAFYLTFAITLQPSYGAFSSYAPAGSTNPAAGLATEGFNASFGFFLLFMGVLCLVFLVCSLRTNLVYVVVFSTLVVAFGLLTGQHFQLAVGNADLAADLQVAAGASLFTTSLALWWIFLATMLEALDFPFKIPLGDISWVIRGASLGKDDDSLA